MLAVSLLQSWTSWPVVPEQVTVPGDRCPPLASGALQTAEVALRMESVETLFVFVFLSSLAIALVGVVLAYGWTRRIGRPFVNRWVLCLCASLVVAALAALVITAAVPVATRGCEAGETVATLPGHLLAGRSLVAAAHGLVFFLLLSWLLSATLGRLLKQGRWYDNHRVPVPALLPWRKG